MFAGTAAAILLTAATGVTVGDWGRGQAGCDAAVAMAVPLGWATLRLRRHPV